MQFANIRKEMEIESLAINGNLPMSLSLIFKNFK